MDLLEFCAAIGLPEAAARRVLLADEALSAELDLRCLREESRWPEGQELKKALGPDPGGWKELACMFRCARGAWRDYETLGLSREIYLDTMACFSRFLGEHLESYGVYGFDRGFWTVRQVSCKLFRIGELEYELTARNGEKIVSLHIPSDAVLETARLRASWERAREILDRVFPAWAGAPVWCHSWLLSPTLGELLGPDSNILRFQESFDITLRPGENTSYLRWVFKNREELPQDTSLQRRLKAHLDAGGRFLDAEGFLKEEPFI